MRIQKMVTVDGRTCPVTVSDEREALLAAQAAGGAIIGIWREGEEELPASCLYLIPADEEIGQAAFREQELSPILLERAARRQLDLPWPIAETERLKIREFAPEDPLEPASEEDGDGVFSDWEKREAYRRNQYRFCECGLWALVRKTDGVLVGKAGMTGGELGYHIYEPFRRQGYGLEACQAILTYAREELALEKATMTIRRENEASRRLAARLGFTVCRAAGVGDSEIEKNRKKNLPESCCILYAKRL